MTERTRWWTFAIVCLALFMAMLDNLVVITALPTIRHALHAGVSDLEWTVNAYTLAFSVLMMTGAALGDRFGRKRVFLAGVILFSAGSAGAALSASASGLEVARAVQGIGSALITPLSLTILTAAFPAERRASIIGLWAGVSGLGLAIGPLVGGAIVSGWTWNGIFWINVPLGVVLLALGAWRLQESRGERQPLDIPGVVLGGAGLFGLTYGLIRGNALGWSSGQVVAAFVLGAAFLAAFALRERTASAPMLDLSLFRARGFSAANISGFLMSAGMFGSIFLLTLYIQQVLGQSPLQAGIKTLAWTGTIMAVAPFAGILAGRIGPRPVVLTGLTLQSASLLWIAAISGWSTPYPQMLPAFIVGGIGMGLTFAPLSEAVMAAVRPERQGQASGAYNAIREVGGVFGVAVLGAVFQHIDTTPAQFMNAFHAALLVGSIAVAVGVVVAVFLPTPDREEQPEHAPAYRVEAVPVEVGVRD
jgi:EmrB/QacA subfamily drug resistance transporter